MLQTAGYTWIVPETATLAGLEDGIRMLRQIAELESDTVRVVTVSSDRPIFVPAGVTRPDGQPFSPGVLTVHSLPPEGLVVHGEEAA